MSRIRRLPKEIAEKIAAGEVVERPASVVKELLENAIDAGASHIVIELENGGTKLVSVADDGEGIAPEDMALVFERHSTSKLRTLDDLYAVRTLGFRGEALASVAAVSRVEMVSARAGQAGARIEVTGGERGEVRPEGAPVGTRITVRDLFFNTPARKKFLKKQSTELGHITSLVQNLAMAYPRIHFELSHNHRKVFSLPGVTNVRERIAHFFGNDLARDLVEVSHASESMSFDALLAPRQHTRANSRSQFVFVNRRYVRDALLIGAVTQSYRGFIESGRFPVAFLFLEIDPADVDVNVHPAKLEIRFRNSSQVYGSVMTALRSELERTWPRTAMPVDEGTLDDRRARIKQKIGDFFLRAESPMRQSSLWESTGAGGSHGGGVPAGLPSPLVLPVRGVMQVHNTYLIEETDEGFRISDQHALHERVLFHEIRARLAESGVGSQQLLTPQMMAVTEQDVLTVEEHAELFARVGLDVKPAGPRTLAISAVPQVLPVEEAPTFIRDALDRLQDDTEERSLEEHLEDLASALACRAAVKAGEQLSRQEVESIIKRAGDAEVRETCPHGRPTTLYITLEELERRFGRK
ncbi:MAG TPA: DNA mismatch repair endonuclease MutL [Planctomycetota bacterium]|nr:DNA mismatch repair endonuclease MutL [Planctomycetota bacterium]